jgi:hypothetical protein
MVEAGEAAIARHDDPAVVAGRLEVVRGDRGAELAE